MPRGFLCKVGLEGDYQLNSQLQRVGAECYGVGPETCISEVEDKVIEGADHGGVDILPLEVLRSQFVKNVLLRGRYTLEWRGCECAALSRFRI